MIFLLIDFLMSYVSSIPTYFFLLNILLIPKDKCPKLIIITLIIDLIFLNTYFLNTIVILLLFILYKHFSIFKPNIFNYILSISLIYFLYINIIGLINHYSLSYIFLFIMTNFLPNLIFYLLCYKIVKSHIKLSR